MCNLCEVHEDRASSSLCISHSSHCGSRDTVERNMAYFNSFAVGRSRVLRYDGEQLNQVEPGSRCTPFTFAVLTCISSS